MAASETAAPVTIAVVGAGYWGKNYVRALNELPQFDLRFVVDSREEIQARYNKQHPGVVVTGDIKEALDDDEVQAVVIATPASTHHALGMQALAAGKHCIIEKPLATSTADAKALQEEAAARGLHILVGFTAIFIPSVMHAKSIIDSADFGTPFYMHSTRTNLGIIRADVNVNWDLVPHDLALFLYWNPHPVQWVSATGVDCVKPGTEKADAVFATIKFSNGVMGHIMASWSDPKKCREAFIVSNKMRVAVDDVDMSRPLAVFHQSIKEEDIGEKVLDAASSFGEAKMITTVGDTVLPRVQWGEPLKNQVLSFHSLLTSPEATTPASAELGVRVVQLLEAIDTSMAANGVPVPISSL